MIYAKVLSEKNVNVLELNNVYFKNDSFKIVAE